MHIIMIFTLAHLIIITILIIIIISDAWASKKGHCNGVNRTISCCYPQNPDFKRKYGKTLSLCVKNQNTVTGMHMKESG